MNRSNILIGLAVAAAVIAGIVVLFGGNSEEYAPPQFAPVVPDPAETGAFSGVVRFEGAVPQRMREPMQGRAECMQLHPESLPLTSDLLVKEGRLQNAIVYLKSGLDPKYRFPIPPEEHLIDNVQCLYVPRVSCARVWQKIRLQNSDPINHNMAAAGYWSKTFMNKGYDIVWVKEPPKEPILLKCDIHNWMRGYLGVFAHPYYAVTGEDGTFRIPGLPAGEYEFAVWHERCGAQSVRIAVDKKGKAEHVFTLRLAP